MKTSTTLSPAQRKALITAEDTPHGLRLDPTVKLGTVCALIDRKLCTPLAAPPGGEDDEDLPARSHWLTTAGVERRNELLAAPHLGETPVRHTCKLRSQGCTQTAAWTLKWKRRTPYGKAVASHACDQHLSPLVGHYSQEAKDHAVTVTPYA